MMSCPESVHSCPGTFSIHSPRIASAKGFGITWKRRHLINAFPIQMLPIMRGKNHLKGAKVEEWIKMKKYRNLSKHVTPTDLDIIRERGQVGKKKGWERCCRGRLDND
ncbi:hypothetical protein I7I50_05789 [Histoplasma capsulatum G186AR]|nr:hypothetical protein I7I50_05789 [Histoplasma capsulatum G186AR]